MSEQAAVALKRTKSRVRPRPSSRFIVPGITGRVRCLSKKNKGQNRVVTRVEREKDRRVSKKENVDIKQVIRDIRRDRERADADREIVLRLKRDHDKGRIHSLQDIQERINHYKTATTDALSTCDSSDDDVQVIYLAGDKNASANTESEFIESKANESKLSKEEKSSNTTTPDDTSKGGSIDIETDSTIGKVLSTKAISSDKELGNSFSTKATVTPISDSCDAYTSNSGDHLIEVIASSSRDLHVYEDDDSYKDDYSLSESETDETKSSKEDDSRNTTTSDSSNDDISEGCSIEIEMSDSTLSMILSTKAISSYKELGNSFSTKTTMTSSSDSCDTYTSDSVDSPGDHLIEVIASSSHDLYVYEDDDSYQGDCSLTASELSVPDLDQLHRTNGHCIGMNAPEYSKAWTKVSKKKSLREPTPYKYRSRPQKYFSTSVAYHSTFGAF